jgi:hypothetical protein
MKPEGDWQTSSDCLLVPTKLTDGTGKFGAVELKRNDKTGG